MGSNEEYLDKLLQSVTNEGSGAPQEKHYDEHMTDEELLASLVEMYSEELAEYKTEEIIHKEDNIVTETAPIENVQTDAVEVNEESVVETVISEIKEEPEVEKTPDKPISGNSGAFDLYGGSEKLSQDDIEKLLSGLMESEAVAEEPVQDSGAKEATADEMLGNSMELSEASLDDKTDDFALEELLGSLSSTEADVEESSAEDSLLKEMGIDTMSAEQIEEMINAAAASENIASEQNTQMEESVEADLDALFNSMSFADGFDTEESSSQDISDLMGEMTGGNDLLKELMSVDTTEPESTNTLENDFDKDANDLLAGLFGGEPAQPQEEAVSVTGEEKVKKPKKEKKPKVKKEKTPKEPKLPKEKKEGESFWKKITSILFEEEEELDEHTPITIGDSSQISMVELDENDGILAELMNEDMLAKGKSKKKKDKENKKDKKKAKKEATEEGDGGEEVIDPKEAAKEAKKKEKAEKAAEKKKARAEKLEADLAFLKAQPSISTKRAMIAFVFAVSIMVIVLIIYFFLPEAVEKKNARKAYYEKNYYEAYELLAGKELNDSDAILLKKTTCILKMQRKLDSYNNYVRMDNDLKAVNALVEAVELYEEEYINARGLSIDGEFDAIYSQIVIILNGKYGITEEMAKEVLDSESDAEYTVKLQSLLNGEVYNELGEGQENKPMEDVLPEEQDFLKGQ